MKIALAGSVESSEAVLQELIRADMPISMVFSLDERYSKNVSGYCPLHRIAQTQDIPYTLFKNINDAENITLLRGIQPDIFFVVGLSQLIGPEILSIAKEGCIGLHPTALPKFRGRAALVWQILMGVSESACTMFMINEGMDSGDIIAQEPYSISADAYAQDVCQAVVKSIGPLTRQVIDQIRSNTFLRKKQDETQATYLLRRTPEDGRILWNKPIMEIHTLIRATSRPYPGAFSFIEGGHKIIIWRADMFPNTRYIGLVGQIAHVDEEGITVVCTDGLLRITQYECSDDVKLRVGHKLMNHGVLR